MIRNIKNFTLISTEIPALHIDRIVFIESTEAALAPVGQLTPEVCTVAPAWVCDGQLWVNFVCAVQTQSCQCTAVRQWSSKTKKQCQLDVEHDDAPHQELVLLRDAITVSQTHFAN